MPAEKRGSLRESERPKLVGAIYQFVGGCCRLGIKLGEQRLLVSREVLLRNKMRYLQLWEPLVAPWQRILQFNPRPIIRCGRVETDVADNDVDVGMPNCP